MTLTSSAASVRMLGLAVALGLTPSAHADDDGLRVTRLTSADLALMLTNVCEATDPSSSHTWGNSPEAVRAEAQRVKDQVSKGLSEGQLLSVLRRAADAARAIALQEVGVLNASDPAVERSRTLSWCAGPVRSTIENFMKDNATAR
ncbi:MULTISPECIES: hypothetical protein [Methylobacterium]|uniref:Uncharacterized protein n=2 Tax=Methylobacterium TaxID=407 RepID=A0ABU0HSS6_9HYPH|nr:MULTISPECIES: hypothetical protein [Methylobacterium]MDQ0445399.1 hypothetical protein [Methylobacterium persicinum]MWV25173.1 hypothetical protein [Methylobacterium sp. 2A]GJE36311.1 hypothetical protein KHHGKMAE_0359 [Methylobacterium persicinum]